MRVQGNLSLEGTMPSSDILDDALRFTRAGLDAARPPSPIKGNIYIATDTAIVYKCVVDGTWIKVKNVDLSGNLVSDLADITSPGAHIEEAVTKRHAVNPVSYHFMQFDVAAGQTAVAIPVLGLVGNTEIVMMRAGSVVGISVASDVARTGGMFLADIIINGVATGLQAALDAINPQYHFANQAGGLDTFVAGDRLGVVVTTDAGWLPTTADIVVSVLVEI